MAHKRSQDPLSKMKKTCFVIAEAGSNHNQSLTTAKRMIEVAKEAGADAVKFQIFRARTLYPKKKINVKYLKNIGIEEDLYSIIKRFEVPYAWIKKLHDHCHTVGIAFMATPFDVHSVRLLEPYVPYFKIASYESLYADLIAAVKQTGKPLFISTGGSRAHEIDVLMRTVLHDYKRNVVLLHCIAKYPAPVEQLQLQTIPALAQKYNVRVGYSDHSADPTLAPVVAVALGACVIEKHFTLDKKLPGPDHAFAVNPQELKAMVQAIRRAEKALRYKGKRDLMPCERELYYYKRCLYTKQALPRGHRIRLHDIEVLRNVGEAKDYFTPLEKGAVIGKQVRRALAAKTIITRQDVR